MLSTDTTWRVITPSERGTEAIIPRKRTGADASRPGNDAGSTGTPSGDFLETLGLSKHVVGLLRDAGLDTRCSIDERSLAEAQGIGPATAAKVLAAIAAVPNAGLPDVAPAEIPSRIPSVPASAIVSAPDPDEGFDELESLLRRRRRRLAEEEDADVDLPISGTPANGSRTPDPDPAPILGLSAAASLQETTTPEDLRSGGPGGSDVTNEGVTIDRTDHDAVEMDPSRHSEREGPCEVAPEIVEEADGDLETSLLSSGPTPRIAVPERDDDDLIFGALPVPAPRPIEEEGPPAIVPVFGGHLHIRRIGEARRSVRCDDPWLESAFLEACARINVPVEDGVAVLPYETCRVLVAEMKDQSVRKRLRTRSFPSSRPPSLVTAYGRISVNLYGGPSGSVAIVKALENDGRIENRLDLVCSALNGRWSEEKASWTIAEDRLDDLSKAMSILPDAAPPSPAEARRAAAEQRRPAAATKDGLTYVIGEDGRPHKDWYRAAGLRREVDVLDGVVHLYRVDDDTSVAVKHDGDGRVNAAIKEAVFSIGGYQGYHGPLNGHKFPTRDTDRMVEALRRDNIARGTSRLI